MTNDKIGEFIKKLREKKKISQTKLADILFVNRTLISKWENGKSTPSMKDMTEMAKIFNVSIEEFLFGDKYNNKNADEINNNFSNFLIKRDNDLFRFKKIVVYLSIIVIIMMTCFFGLYFYQTYNKTKIYRIYGQTDEYECNDGILLLTNNKSYMRIGNMNKPIDKIKVFYVDNDNNEQIMYEGDPNNIQIDYAGYDAIINNHNFKKIKDRISMYIYNKNNVDLMHLNFKEDFRNDTLWYVNSKPLANSDSDMSSINDNIPQKIKKDFECDDSICQKLIDNMQFIYDIAGETMYITNQEETVSYDIINNYFIYNKLLSSFTAAGDKISCDEFNCDSASKIYKYYMKYIKKYI